MSINLPMAKKQNKVKKALQPSEAKAESPKVEKVAEQTMSQKSEEKTAAKAAEAESESEEENSPAEDSDNMLESDSDLDEQDEFDVGNEPDGSASGTDGESDSGSESESDDDFPRRKKAKTDDGRGTFATAFNAILGSKLKAHARKDPILARNKSTMRKLELDKLEAKAKRLMRMEKKEVYDKQRVKNPFPPADQPEKVREVLEREKKFRKTAQRGVVKLFNAVLATQVLTQQELDQEKGGVMRKQELVNELTKLKFLDLVKAAGEE